MQINAQDRILTELEDKIAGLKNVLKETIEKHSDAAYDLKVLKTSLEEMNSDKLNTSLDKMLVMASEWEDSE